MVIAPRAAASRPPIGIAPPPVQTPGPVRLNSPAELGSGGDRDDSRSPKIARGRYERRALVEVVEAAAAELLGERDLGGFVGLGSFEDPLQVVGLLAAKRRCRPGPRDVQLCLTAGDRPCVAANGTLARRHGATRRSTSTRSLAPGAGTALRVSVDWPAVAKGQLGKIVPSWRSGRPGSARKRRCR